MRGNRLLIILLLLPFAVSSQTQNLVPDSSFEIMAECPTLVSQIGLTTHWKMPTKGTSDLYSECRELIEKNKGKKRYFNPGYMVSVPSNNMGFQYAHSGQAYAGAYWYVADGREYTEYIETQLTQPLEKGKQYCVTYYISLADISNYYLDEAGVVFYGKDNLTMNISNPDYKRFIKSLSDKNESYINVRPSVVFDIANNKDTVAWQPLCGVYMANGGETNMIIGVFANGKSWKIGNKAYYFIDDVSVYETADGVACRCAPKEIVKVDTVINIDAAFKEVVVEPVLTEKPFIIPHLNFDTDSWDIKPEAFATLDSLVAYIQTLKGYKVEISGHTDDVGGDLRNLHLSENRAKSVAEYLIKKGVNKTIITHKGYGETVPISTTNKDENRRVEIKLIRQ